MEPVEEKGAKRGLKAAKEPLSLRFLLAFSASTVLTAAVAIPMAFQAHLAREDQQTAARMERRPSVLGTTTVPGEGEHVSSRGLVHADGPDRTRSSLDGAELTGDEHLFLELPDVVRVDFVLDDGAVHTDHEHPWQPGAGELPALEVGPGEHTLTATVTFEDGTVEVRRATFSVATS